MTTIINTPTPSNDSGGSTGMIVGLLVVVLMVFLFFYYGLPAIKSIQVGTPQINIPNKIDVNVIAPTP